jgi:hypothetical protein
MIVDSVERLSPILPAWLEALLRCERDIEPQTSSIRARALNRARANLTAGPVVSLPHPPSPGWYRIAFGSAGGVGLLATAALLQLASPRYPSSHDSNPQAAPATQLASPSVETGTQTALVPLPSALGEESLDGETVARVPSTGHPAAESETALDELEMLERAQRSDARADFLAVLSIAAEHERRYPKGRLGEEREVLRLRALIGLKRSGEARRAVRKFHHDYPHSVLLPTLDEMLAAAL